MRSPAKKKRGGRRVGAGRPADFVPTKATRELIKMHLALRGYTHAELCETLINPATGLPISTDTFARVFAREIKTAKIEIDGIAGTGFVRQLRRGNMTAFIWHSKTQWGWSDKMIEQERRLAVLEERLGLKNEQ